MKLMWSFRDDLIKGKEWELKVLQVLKGEWMKLIQNPDEKWMDLLFIEEWIEVKKDEYAQYSGNFYIEFECNWKPSWLFRPEDYHLRYWAHTDWVHIYLMNWDYFKEFVNERIASCRANKTNTSKWFKVIEWWGNWWKSKWLLIPIEAMKEIAYEIYKY
jgi:hypothetical protein